MSEQHPSSITLHGWGSGADGCLGVDSEKSSTLPTVVKAAQFLQISQVACGEFHTIAASQKGHVYSWGSDQYGAIGRPCHNNSLPELVPLLYDSHTTQVACGRFHSVAITVNGQVFTWGRNNRGQLGTGDVGIHRKPALVELLSFYGISIIQIQCGDSFTLARTRSGTLYAWGDNTYSQVGRVATPVAITQPAKVPTQLKFVDIRCGSNHVLALTEDGSLYSWGSNQYGQLGIGRTHSSTVAIPTRVALPSKVISFSTGSYHSICCLQDGTVYCFGQGYFGQLGNGTYTCSWSPVKVDVPKRANRVFAGGYHSMATCADSSIFMFGSNSDGQLGISEKLRKSGQWKYLPTSLHFFQVRGLSVQTFHLGYNRTFCFTSSDPITPLFDSSSGKFPLYPCRKYLLSQFFAKETSQTPKNIQISSSSIRTLKPPQISLDVQSLTIFCGSWNLGASKPRENLKCYLTSPRPYDIYALSFQEMIELSAAGVIEDKTKTGSDSNIDAWKRAVEQYLPFSPKINKNSLNSSGSSSSSTTQIEKHAEQGYVCVGFRQLFGLVLMVYIKKSLAPYIRNPFTSSLNIGMNALIANKGGVACRFEIFDSSFCFVGTHLASGLERCSRRNKDHLAVLDGLRMRHWALCDHDHLFWAGDLNYRIQTVDFEMKRLIASGDIKSLLEIDQLTVERRKGTTFRGFQEAPITFLPTYKYNVGNDGWDTSKYKSPAWCDRVLWISGDCCSNLSYSRAELRLSDHRPVFGVFNVITWPKSVIPAQKIQDYIEKLTPNSFLGNPDAKVDAPPLVAEMNELLGGTNNSITLALSRSMTHRIFKSGFLTKRGKTRKSWRKRWFVLTGETLSYYKSVDNMTTALGTLPLSQSNIYIPDHKEQSTPSEFHFQIVVPGRIYYICADNEETLSEWINTIRMCSQFARGFVTETFQQSLRKASLSAQRPDLTPIQTEESNISPSSSTKKPSIMRLSRKFGFGRKN